MALVKSSRISAGETKGQAIADGPVAAEAAVRRPKERGPSGTRHAKASERVAAATEQLTSGLSEAAAAAEELRRSMEQIAAGSEEAASASQEQLEAIRSVLADFDTARGEAESSRRRTEGAQIVLTETAVQITASVRAIEKNAERQFKSVAIIAELERRAQDIGEIIQTVSRIADQTNLLALNAAIEAARAGDHGRGFAVVAEEVRALAETSEKSAQDVQGFAEAIQARVREVVEAVRSAAERAAAEAKTGIAAVDGLGALRRDMSGIAEGSQNTALAAAEAERAASEGLRGAEQVATAAEEQSAAANEAQTAIQQQAQSLDQGQIAAQSMAALADELRGGRTEAAEQIGVAAEQLSASVQELSSAASQIMVAVAQINRGSQLQAAAAQQTSAALTQIESSAAVARSNAEAANAQAEAMAAGLRENRTRIEGLVTGVENALRDTAASLELILGIETVGRRIDKAVDTIVLVAVQTSMLAVSGAVEAARTGDSGRGFAVVSHDIRNLAREASDSADRVKDTVRGIIDQVASVRRYLEQIITLADAEVERNRPLFDTLMRVDGEVAALGIANAAIVQRADAIRAAVGQTAAGARQIATAAAQASAASRQAAIASSEQARGAEDLAAAIEEIASLADELKQPNG